MLYVLIAIGGIALVGISVLAMRHLSAPANQDWLALKAQRRALESKLSETIVAYGPSESHEPACDHPAADAIWVALEAGNTDAALALAEEAMAADRESSEARLLLASALLAKGDYGAAEAQLAAATELGNTSPHATYLAGRIEIEQYLHSIAPGQGAHRGALLMPAELLALDLHVRLGDSGDASALWMPGQGEVTQEQAREFVLVHFGAYYRILESLLEATRAEPFGDGLYEVGRLALKCGFSELGAEFLTSLEDSMVGSAYHKDYQLVMATLRGETPPPESTPIAKQTVSSSGKNVVKLKVLN